MRRGATDAVMVSRGDAETRRVCPKGRGSFRATLSTSHVPWPKAKLGEVAIEFIDGDRGKNYPKQHDFSSKGHCLFLNAENVTSEGFKFDALKFISEEKDHSLRKGKVSRGDVILTTRGTVGNAAIYDEDVPFANVRINSGMVILRCDNRKVLPSYLYFCLQTQDFLSQVNGFKSGVAQPQLPIKDLKQIEIPIPPLPVQRRIADILSAYDDLIENNRRRIATLEEAARLAYRKWFGGEVGRKATLGKVSDFFDISIGRTPPRKSEECFSHDLSDVKWLSIKDMKAGRVFAFDSSERLTGLGVEKTKIHVSPPGTIFLSFKLTVGVVVIAGDYMATNEAIAHFETDDRALRDYTYFYLSLFQYDKLGSTSAIAKAINSDIIRKMDFVLPNRASLGSYEKEVEPMFDQIENLTRQSAALAAARDMLLPRLMKGEMSL